ncbi:unnamed protein product [Peniophora sp. CBMAI 1063]|nr:unnamed protein product [Peniophora sp. CBMAI 1063]
MSNQSLNLDKKDGASEQESVHDAPVNTPSIGGNKIEALRSVAKSSPSVRRILWVIGIGVGITSFAYAIQVSTSSNFSVWATSSFESHSSGLSALSVATTLISSICKPFLAKFSDVFGRPSTYFVGTLLYLVGFIVISQSPTLAAYIIGNVLGSLGGSTVDFMNNVIIADLTDLQWRGFYIACLGIPYLITPWFSASIVESLGTTDDWRWGYLMFAIILPVSTLPVIGALVWLHLRAKKLSIRVVPTAERVAGVEDGVEQAVEAPRISLALRVRSSIHELDALGLLLLGFGWTLLLLPFSLESGAKGRWSNPSMIVMIVVGAICLIAFILFEALPAPSSQEQDLYEYVGPPFPPPTYLDTQYSCAVCIIINFVYDLATMLETLYLSSYTDIVSDWSLQGWTYYSNTLNISLCAFGIVAGALQRLTHRYKALQVSGLCLQIVAYGLLISPTGKAATTSTALLVVSQVISGMGGAFSVVGSAVAAQASVPHEDMALVMALLALWASVGASIGSAISSVIWSRWMPVNLRQYVPASVNDTQVAEFYADITLIRAYDFDDPVRQGAIEAYRHTLWVFLVPALVLSFITLGAACFQTNYFLGEQHDAVTGTDPGGEVTGNQQEGKKVDTSAMSMPRKALYYVFGA